MTEDERKKVALFRLRKLLPALGRKLDLVARRSREQDPSFAELADEVAELLGPFTRA